MHHFPASGLFQLRDDHVAKWITPDDRHQFEFDGFLVVRNVVPHQLTEAAVRDIAAFVRADLNLSSSWYNGVPQNDGIVPLHHAQSLWDIRQCPNVYEVLSEFWGMPQLFVDINRCLFRPPFHPRRPALSRSVIHWDTDPRAPGLGSLQAVVLLTDVGRNEGGYQCIPEVYRDLDSWLARNATHPSFDFFNPGLHHRRSQQVTGRAGDMILWSTKLPHGSGANLSKRPRIAMFVCMQPPSDDLDLPEKLKSWWLTKRAPDYWRGLPGQLDPEPGQAAILTELGRRLIGALPW
jgi:hypothetical protein